MPWNTPTFDEIKMDAEIGSYQEDYDSSPDPVLDGSQTRQGGKWTQETDIDRDHFGSKVNACVEEGAFP